MEEKKKNKHKYSTYTLIGLILLVSGIVLVESVDGTGSANSIAKWINGDRLGSSNIYDDLNATLNLSTVCTASNGLCGSLKAMCPTGASCEIEAYTNGIAYENTSFYDNVELREVLV